MIDLCDRKAMITLDGTVCADFSVSCLFLFILFLVGAR